MTPLFKPRDSTSPGARLRALLAAGYPVPSVWGGTPHHAQLAEAAGIPVFGMSGSHASTQLLGLPDVGLMTMSEMVENLRRICRVTSLPTIVDCDTGFGNAINVCRTVDEVIRAGAAGLFMEDQVSPKRCGFVKGKDVISIEEAVGKYRAACDVRNAIDPSLVIIARSDVRGAPGGSMDAVIERGMAYFDAGVDIYYPEGIRNHDELRILRQAFPDRLLTLPTIYVEPALTESDMVQLGLCLCWVFLEQVGAIAMYEFLKDYKARGELARIEYAKKNESHWLGSNPRTGYGLYDLVGLSEVSKLEQKYLPPDVLERRNQSQGLYDPTARQSGEARA